jgi:tRNA threonylcarbamoyladenosine biosynthesis protein TsaB
MLPMKILSFDTTNNLASVAVMNNNELLSYNTTDKSSQQAEKLFFLIDKALSEAKFNLTDIDIVSVTNGPGSFTGVRIGLSSALGMQMGCKAEFIAISNFQALAWLALQDHPKDHIAVILDARRDQVYLQIFNKNLESLGEAKVVDISSVEGHLPKDVSISFVGDGVKLLPQLRAKEELMINVNAEILAQATEFFYKKKLYGDLIPLYIREPDAVAKPLRSIQET